MKVARFLAFVVFGYLALVVAFEGFVGVMGQRHAARGLAPGDGEVVLTTTAADGSARDTVVAAVEVDGRLYVAANHWPRAWYVPALAQPELELTRGGARSPHRAVAIDGAELERVAQAYALPAFLRVLTGFPPRRFLRLDPR